MSVRDGPLSDSAARPDATPDGASALTFPARDEVLAVIRLVNDRFIQDHADPGDVGWKRAVYFIGDTAAYRATNEPRYRNYAVTWASNHGYRVGRMRGADDLCAGQTYEGAFALSGDASDLTDTRTVLEAMIQAKSETDWSWVDALFMGMPTFAIAGAIAGDTAYFDEMHLLYEHTKTAEGGTGLWSPADGLWWRDATFLPPYAEPNGKPCFWGRGNGWAMAAHARVLDVLPASDAHRSEYLDVFEAMAAAIRPIQRTDGFWNVSLLDPAHFGGPDESVTALFAYSLSWGIRSGVLDRTTYEPVLVRAWQGLLRDAVSASGSVGWVQGAGTQPSSAQPVRASSTSDFGVGLFLLAAAEIATLAS